MSITVKTVDTLAFNRETASKITAEQVYSHVILKAGTQKVSVSLEAGVVHANGRFAGTGNLIPVPRGHSTIDVLIPGGFEECRIIGTFTAHEDQHFPGQLMTRMDFMMETLNLWQELRDGALLRAPGHIGKKSHLVVNEIEAAMELLKETYSYQELGTNMDEFSNNLTILKLEDIKS